jgi:hypothetical protein
VRTTIDAVHTVDSSIPVVLGGQAAASSATAISLGAQAWAADGAGAVEVISDLAQARRVLWLEPHGGPGEAERARTA